MKNNQKMIRVKQQTAYSSLKRQRLTIDKVYLTSGRILRLEDAVIDSYDNFGMIIFEGKKRKQKQGYYISHNSISFLEIGMKRRSLGVGKPEREKYGERICEEVVYNPSNLTLSDKNKIIQLGPREGEFIRLLFSERIGGIVPLKEFEEVILEYNPKIRNIESATMVEICRVRKKLRKFGLNVKSVANKGYELERER